MIIKTTGLSITPDRVTMSTFDVWRLIVDGLKTRGICCDEAYLEIVIRGRLDARNHSLSLRRYTEDFRGKRPLKTKGAHGDE